MNTTIHTEDVNLCYTCGNLSVEGKVGENNEFCCKQCDDVDKSNYREEVFEDPRLICKNCKQLSSKGTVSPHGPYEETFICNECIFAVTSHVCVLCDEGHTDGELDDENFEFYCHKCFSKQDPDWKPTDLAWHYLETWPAMLLQ